MPYYILPLEKYKFLCNIIIYAERKQKITFGDLDGFLKFAPIIGIGILAYLQTLFPSKIEFEKLEDHLIQMDKKITEITILQKDTSNNTESISSLNNRVREIEISLAKHNKNQ